MSLKLGNTSIGSLYLGSTKIAEAYLGSTKVYGSAAPVDPYNPLNLPPMTMRVKLAAGSDPTMQYWATQTSLVDATENIWDITVSSFSYIGYSMAYSCPPIELLGANTAGVTSLGGMLAGCATLTSVALFDTRSATTLDTLFEGCSNLTTVPLYPTGSVTSMGAMFHNCSSLTTVPLFDTSSVEWMAGMFAGCTSLTSVPLFNTGRVTNMTEAFKGCTSVTHGALALYQQVSTQTNPPAQHTDTFTNCGSNTVTGAAELSQIPQDWGGTYDPYNPLGLPAKTIRCKFSSGTTPTMGDSQTLVDATDNVWDITKNSTDWTGLFNNTDLTEILGANTSGVTNMSDTFSSSGLEHVALFDTSSVTNMNNMFGACFSLINIPLFPTDSVQDMDMTFGLCTAVESGALALYQQASSQANPPQSHDGTFVGCGEDTATGAAELAQIPSDWK